MINKIIDIIKTAILLVLAMVSMSCFIITWVMKTWWGLLCTVCFFCLVAVAEPLTKKMEKANG